MPEPHLTEPHRRTDRILLIGTARSGTSWTGRALACAAGTRYVNEPDNVDADPAPGAPVGRLGYGPFPLLLPGERAPRFDALWELAWAARLPNRKGVGRGAARLALRIPRQVRDPLLARVSQWLARAPGAPRHTVAKSVMAHFALDWLVGRFQPQVVLIQRNPLNVVSSWVELNVHGFDIHSRPAILERYAEPLGVAPPSHDASRLSLTAWWVGLLAATLARAAAAHPDWIVISHETLCEDANGAFRDLYMKLGLTWTERTDRFLDEYGYHRPTFRPSYAPDPGLNARQITKAQPHRWRERLSRDQVFEIQSVLDGFPTRGWVQAPVAS
jgi:hypothetical protein